MGYNVTSKNSVVEKAGQFLSGCILVTEYLIKVISKTVMPPLFDMSGIFHNTVIVQFTKATAQSRKNHPIPSSSNHEPGNKSVKSVIKPSVDEGSS